MSIFSGLFRSRDKPKNRTAGSAYTFYTGRTTAGKAVTQRSAMQMTAVYSCVRILSEARLQVCLCTFTDTLTMAVRKKQRTVLCTFCSTMSRTLK